MPKLGSFYASLRTQIAIRSWRRIGLWLLRVYIQKLFSSLLFLLHENSTLSGRITIVMWHFEMFHRKDYFECHGYEGVSEELTKEHALDTTTMPLWSPFRLVHHHRSRRHDPMQPHHLDIRQRCDALFWQHRHFSMIVKKTKAPRSDSWPAENTDIRCCSDVRVVSFLKDWGESL